MAIVVRFEARHTRLFRPCIYPLYTITRNNNKIYIYIYKLIKFNKTIKDYQIGAYLIDTYM